jgi:spermidine synthase
VRWPRVVLPAAAGLLAAFLATADGPSGFWRHSPIGAGRVRAPRWTAASLIEERNQARRNVLWEADGVESSVAATATGGLSVHVNGKSDSNVVMDAATTVMSGLLLTMLHGDARQALVIGLGTGGTAGWLAEVPTMERVDTVELEEAVVEVARLCNPATHGAVGHPRVNIIIADGREVVLTSRERYDVILSEPSNPYRAGIASLFTAEFYRGIADRLTDDGIFAQWVQAYEVDPQTLRTAAATMASVFPHVETWEVYLNADVLFIASNRPLRHDVARVRELAAQEPFRSALENTWGVSGAEGVFAGFVADDGLARAIQRAEGDNLNTDDLTIMEYQFARTVGMEIRSSVMDLRRLAVRLGHGRPPGAGEELDWDLVQEMRSARALFSGASTFTEPVADAARHARIEARRAYSQGRHNEARRLWASQPGDAEIPVDQLMLADLAASSNAPDAAARAETLRARHPVEAEVLLARNASVRGDAAQATTHLVAAFERYRTAPWAWARIAGPSVQLARDLSRAYPQTAAPLVAALGEPFAVEMFRDTRLRTRLAIAMNGDFEALCREPLAALEPDPPWDAPTLAARVRCYRAHGHPLAERATDDMELFLSQNPTSLTEGLGVHGAGGPLAPGAAPAPVPAPAPDFALPDAAPPAPTPTAPDAGPAPPAAAPPASSPAAADGGPPRAASSPPPSAP